MREKAVDIIKRYSLLAVALFILAFGISLSVRADLGTSPVASPQYVISRIVPFSMGQVTTASHILFILIQIALLRRDFRPIQLLQLAVAFVFGWFTDLTLWMTSAISPEGYVTRWLCTLAGIAVISLGVFLEVRAKTVTLAGEGVILAISKVFHKEFGKVKIGFDISQVAIAVVVSLVAFGEVRGVREGTVAAALLVGVCIRFISKLFPSKDSRDK